MPSARTLVAVLLIAAAALPVLAATSRPLADQPWPDSAEYAEAAFNLARGQGYVTRVHERQDPNQWDYRTGPQPPRYPPGTSLALVPFVAATGDPSGANLGVKVYAAALVLLAGATAWRLSGPPAAVLAAGLTGSSPFVLTAGTIVVSDGIAALCGLGVLGLVLARRATAAGLLAGLSLLVRPANAILVLALLLGAPSLSRRRILLGCLPGLLALLAYQWATFGSPLRTGYDYWLPDLQAFSASYAFQPTTGGDGPWIVPDRLEGALMGWACPGCGVGGAQRWLPNLLAYPATLLGLFWIFAPPLVPAIGLIWCWRRRSASPERLTLVITVATLVLFTFYFYQGSRFLAIPALQLTVFSAAALVAAAGQLTSRYQPHESAPKTPPP